jgi:hypothetical protein
MVPSLVIGDADLPRFGKQWKVKAIVCLVTENLEKSVAGFEFVECKLHFNNVQGQEIAWKFTVVRGRSVTLLEFAEKLFERWLGLFKESIFGQIWSLNAALFCLKWIFLNLSIGQLGVLNEKLTEMVDKDSYPGPIKKCPTANFIEGLKRFKERVENVILNNERGRLFSHMAMN